MLVGLNSGSWEDSLLKQFSVNKNWLPTICPSFSCFGQLKNGFLKGLEVRAVMGDQQAALFAHGQAKATFGTGAFLLISCTKDQALASQAFFPTIAFQKNSGGLAYALEAPIAGAGSAIEWLKNMGLLGGDLEAVLRNTIDPRNVIFVPALGGLLSPFWQSDRRAAFLNLELGTRREHLIRAVAESIMFSVKAVLFLLTSGIELEELSVDGGLSNSDQLMQMLSNLLELPIARPRLREATAFGVAKAAAVSCGFQDWGIDAMKEKDVFVAKECEGLKQRYRVWLSVINNL